MGIRVIAFVLLTCFYGAYFYKQVDLSKKGIHTNRLAKGQKPKRTRAIETCLLAMTYTTALVQFASVFWAAHMHPLPFPIVLRAIGLFVAAVGVTVFIAALIVMRDNWRAGVDEGQKTVIVTKGVYKLSRNPAFVGFDLLYIGSALSLPNVVLVITAVISIYLLHLQILEEERYLSPTFGSEYSQYKRDTPRYLLFKRRR